MCGIAGKYIFESEGRVGRYEIESMLHSIQHRGPDGAGILIDRNVGLGHRRLSIIDLEGGSQPMTNEDSTVWVVFNGEIYNFAALCADLTARGHIFRSRSDTEVIVHLYEEYGPSFVHHLDGMFALALWDSRPQRLVLARDRVGIKPLYYANTGPTLLFASELKAIITDPAVSRELSASAVQRFLSFYYVPGDTTIFRSIQKLLPGHCLIAEEGHVSVSRYWDLQFSESRFGQTFVDTARDLHGLVHKTVRNHLIADVPVGVLLSGGVDSSAVLSFAAQSGGPPVKTFTIGFGENGLIDERPYARLAARRFGTEHHELTITAEDFWNFLPAYAWHMEEPVCEPPAVALYYVSLLASKHVKVLLSGEGGDEAFAGYPNYVRLLQVERLNRLLGPLSRAAGSCLAQAGKWLHHDAVRRYGAALGRPLHEHYFSRSSSPTTFFNQSNGEFFHPAWRRLLPPPNAAAAAQMDEVMQRVPGAGLLDRALYADTATWLPDDLLVKADKITMANSVELRVPLLDHHLLEFAASLPPAYKVSGGETKRVLKAAFARELPDAILSRKKAGFPVPYGNWLRGPLADRVRDVLLSDRAISRGYFQPRGVEQLLASHAAHGRQAKEVFSLLALEYWHRAFVDGVAPTQLPSLPPLPSN